MTSRRSYIPATSVIDPTAPGGIAALLDFHRRTFGDAVMEAGESDGDNTGGDNDGGEGGAGDKTTAVNEHGFPDGTPWREMTAEHQAAYWRHQSRRHEQRANAAADYEQVKAERDQLKSEKQTPAEKDAENARAQAADAARAEERGKFAPRLVAAEFKSYGAGKIPSAQLASLISGAHAPNFLTSDGEVDTDKVADYLKPFVSDGDEAGSKKWPDMGQGRRPSSPTKGVGTGRDLFADRHPKKK